MTWFETKLDHDINFLEIETQVDAEFIGPPATIESRPTIRKTRIVLEQRVTRERDEATMARFARENPHLVQAETEFFWKRDDEPKKVGRKTKNEAGPFGLVKLKSDDEV
ncbi:uncharacterized protein [Aegilops tauschii subsp. strangulata]|uniref:uncharacterized protein n=1 Tax=Aegilops tauschii subsp. strangulata TaxID=200361 RepID=UPI003CC8A0F1